MKTPFRFDGHGVNDADGMRIATLYKPVDLYQNDVVRADFHRTGELLASAPFLLDALIDLLAYTLCLQKGETMESTKACEAIRKASGL